MINRVTKKMILACIVLLCAGQSFAQDSVQPVPDKSASIEADKRIDDYLRLLTLGFSEREIFQDLGNANFLAENYDTAAFWYNKLIELYESRAVHSKYHDRYQFALLKSQKKALPKTLRKQDWFSIIEADYQPEEGRQEVVSTSTNGSSRRDFRSPEEFLAATSEMHNMQSDRATPRERDAKLAYQQAYRPPMTVTNDGSTAYFSKAVHIKPEYGLFSKRQIIHKIYRAEKVNGQWSNEQEVAVVPKHFSAIHPAISEDGKRLFFASNMPGTFGKYDIYVADIARDGSVGVAKNLGEKVNTAENDLYPNLVNGTLLFFASDGREGHGGLDIYATQIARSKVGLAMNLGAPVNSAEDDFAIAFTEEDGKGIVMSNRGTDRKDVQQLAFTYGHKKNTVVPAKNDYKFAESLSDYMQDGYTNTVFND